MGIEPGAVLQDTYRIVRRVGQGGMGEVYEATHARLSGRYAVKLLTRELASSSEAFARFRREAEITSGLRHPSIVQVIDFNQTPDGTPYLVMEFLEGVDLATQLGHRGPMPIDRALALIKQVASALAAAHSQGVVHRDLKPQNVFLVPLIGQGEIAKILDFGISKVKGVTKNLTRDTVLGTPNYMSPEQALGRGAEVDALTDQFALAAMAYEMVSGREAFAGENVAAILFQVVHEAPPSLADVGVPVEIEEVILRGLSKRKAMRFPGVLDFARALEAASGASHITPTPVMVARLSAAALAPTFMGSSSLTTSKDPDTLVRNAPTNPTTFGSTASELLNPEIRRRRRQRNLVGGAGAVAVTAVLAVVLLRSNPKTPPPIPVAAVPAAAVAVPRATAFVTPHPASAMPIVDEVVVDVTGVPPGLQVTVDGVVADLPIGLVRNSGLHTLKFEAPGFEPKELTVDAKKGRSIALDMKRRAERAARAPARSGGRVGARATTPPVPSRAGKRGAIIDDL